MKKVENSAQIDELRPQVNPYQAAPDQQDDTVKKSFYRAVIPDKLTPIRQEEASHAEKYATDITKRIQELTDCVAIHTRNRDNETILARKQWYQDQIDECVKELLKLTMHKNRVV